MSNESNEKHVASSTFRDDILWDDGTLIHACEGDRAVSFDPATFLVWTKCGRDVPAGRAFEFNGAAVTCDTCNKTALDGVAK